MGIHVVTKDGVVTLSGIATSESQIKEAIKLAECVEHVRRIESKIKVK